MNAGDPGSTPGGGITFLALGHFTVDFRRCSSQPDRHYRSLGPAHFTYIDIYRRTAYAFANPDLELEGLNVQAGDSRK